MTHHSTAGERLMLLMGVGGAAASPFKDRMLSIIAGALASLVVGVTLELVRPWLQRRARKLAGQSEPPPSNTTESK